MVFLLNTYCFNLLFLGCTIQSLMEQLKFHNNQIQFWDELNTLVESFGVFNSGKGAYERSIFNTLANGEEFYEISTIKHDKVAAEKPRITALAAGHPHRVIELLIAEMKANSDGFWSRWMIINAPSLHIPLSKFICIF